MKRLPPILLAGLLCAGFSGCKKDERPRAAQWQDPANDVLPFPNESGWVQPDIVAAQASSAEGVLTLSLDMPFSIKDYYLQLTDQGYRRGQLLATFYIDADNNSQTGQHPLQRPERPGYEYSVPLSLGFWAKSKDTGLERSGQVTFDPRTFVYKRVPTFEVYKLHPDYRESVLPGVHVGVKSYDSLTLATGNRMEIRIPAKLLGIERGTQIRVCFHEASAGPGPEAYSEDKTLVWD
jgi:hypothetical protein